MKILLTAINAKYIHSNLAVYSLRSYARTYADHIALGEYTINQRVDDILEDIYKQQPDVLMFSCYIWNIEYVKEIAAEFHKLRSQVPIWLGGPEVSYETDAFLKKNSAVTGLFVGEGEKTFLEVCKYYINQEGQLKDIAGLVFRRPDMQSHVSENAYLCKKEELVHTGLRMPMDMDELVFCYENLQDFENRIIYYESSRGCPFSCSYCLSSIDKKLRFRSLDLVLPELQFFLDRKVRQVKFIDRTFNCDHRHSMAIWKYLADHDNGVTGFHFEIAADLLRQDEIDLIATMRPGLIQLEIGVQSTNPDTVKEIHRTMDLDKLKAHVKQVQVNKNVLQHLDLIAGLPYEDYETFQVSFNEIYQLKPEELQLGFLKVLKGSYMYEHAKEYEVIYKSKPTYEVMATRWLSYQELIRIRLVEEMLEVYYNSGQYDASIRMLEQAYDNAFQMFLSLGHHYEAEGLLQMSHSRIRRCEILLDFVKRNHPELENMMMEALTYDLYSREKMKKRPSFARDLSSTKQEQRLWLKKEGLEHSYVHLDLFSKSFMKFYMNSGIGGTMQFKHSFGEELKQEQMWILFDYDHREALTGLAQIRMGIDIEEMCEEA